MKSSEVCNETSSPPASLPIQGQVTKHTTLNFGIPVTFQAVQVAQVDMEETAKRKISLGDYLTITFARMMALEAEAMTAQMDRMGVQAQVRFFDYTNLYCVRR